MSCVSKSLISTCAIYSNGEWMPFVKMTANKDFQRLFLCHVQDVVVLHQT